jgi:hypothetical protein
VAGLGRRKAARPWPNAVTWKERTLIATMSEHVPSAGELVRLLSAPQGSRDWAVGLRYEIHTQVNQAETDWEYVSHCLGGLLRSGGWRLFRSARGKSFRSFIQFCLAPHPYGLGLTEEQVRTAVELLN